MRSAAFLLLTSLLPASAAFAQDERRVVSSDGQVEFRLFINGQQNNNLSRIAYQVKYRGKVLVDTSYLGIELYTWEPILGENVGLISEKRTASALTAHFMQNGSLARLLDVEVRAFNDGVAFRCTIGTSTGVERLQIADDTTQFDLPHDPGAPLTVPFFTEQKGVGWVAIAETPIRGFPGMNLAWEDAGRDAQRKILLARLTRRNVIPDVVYEGKAPLTFPWRMILIAPDKERLMQLVHERQATLASQP